MLSFKTNCLALIVESKKALQMRENKSVNWIKRADENEQRNCCDLKRFLSKKPTRILTRRRYSKPK